MAYDGSSLYGDIICEDYYDISNNFMNPESAFGYFMYIVMGGMFDLLAKHINQFRIDLSVLDCDVGKNHIVTELPEELEDGVTYYTPIYVAGDKNYYIKYSEEGSKSLSISDDAVLSVGGAEGSITDDCVLLFDGISVDLKSNLILAYDSTTHYTHVRNRLDTFYSKEYGFIRPQISYVIDGVVYHRLLSDKEFKIYLYLRNHQLLTIKDLRVAFGNAFNTENVTVQFSTYSLESSGMVSHVSYDNPPFSNTGLERLSSSDNDVVTDMLIDDDTTVVNDFLTKSSIIQIIIPGTWDKYFLLLLEEYSSIKGNVIITQGG